MSVAGVFLVSSLLMATPTGGSKVQTQVRQLLAEQAEAWSRGDIAAFCAVYADDAMFISPSGITRGRAAIRARYEKKYPTAEKMGQLQLDVLEVRLFSEPERPGERGVARGRTYGATVMMRWTLKYPNRDPATGLSMVALRPHGDGWRIVQDASM